MSFLKLMNRKYKLEKFFIEMFGCDTARIVKPDKTMFLIIGHKRNTKDDKGQWVRNSEPIDFDYVKEETVARGKTNAELIDSAKEYKRLLGLSWDDYLNELIPARHSASAEKLI